MRKIKLGQWFVTAAMVLMSMTASAEEGGVDYSKGLTSALMSSLGVTEEQANGGMGSILELAKSTLSSDEFKTLAGDIPGVSEMLAAVPDVSESDTSKASGLLGGFGSDSLSSLASSAMVKEQFDALGLNSDMIGQFLQVGMDYLNSEQGEQTMALLKKGVSSLL